MDGAVARAQQLDGGNQRGTTRAGGVWRCASFIYKTHVIILYILRRFAFLFPPHAAYRRSHTEYLVAHGRTPKILIDARWAVPQRVVAVMRCSTPVARSVLVKWWCATCAFAFAYAPCTPRDLSQLSLASHRILSSQQTSPRVSSRLRRGLSYEQCTWESLGVHPDLPALYAQHVMWDISISLPPTTTSAASAAKIPSFPHGGNGDDQPVPVPVPGLGKNPNPNPHPNFVARGLCAAWMHKEGVVVVDSVGRGDAGRSAMIALLAAQRSGDRRGNDTGIGMPKPSLVLVPGASMHRWIDEFAAVAPQLNVVEYGGSAASRGVVQEHEWATTATTAITAAAKSAGLRRDELAAVAAVGLSTPKFHVLVATHEAAAQDIFLLRQVSWESMIVVDDDATGNDGREKETTHNNTCARDEHGARGRMREHHTHTHHHHHHHYHADNHRSAAAAYVTSDARSIAALVSSRLGSLSFAHAVLVLSGPLAPHASLGELLALLSFLKKSPEGMCALERHLLGMEHNAAHGQVMTCLEQCTLHLRRGLCGASAPEPGQHIDTPVDASAMAAVALVTLAVSEEQARELIPRNGALRSPRGVKRPPPSVTIVSRAKDTHGDASGLRRTRDSAAAAAAAAADGMRVLLAAVHTAVELPPPTLSTDGGGKCIGARTA